MGKEYRYRKHISWMQYALPIISFIFCIIVLLTFLRMPLFTSKPHLLVFVLIAFAFYTLFLCGILWYPFYRLAGIRVSVDEEAIVYKFRRGEKRILFESISQLKFPSVRYTGGWVKIISQEHTIRLTVVVENIGDFLQELKNGLDKKGLSDFYDKAKLFSFLKTASYADYSWARLYMIFGKLVLFTILNIIIALVFSALAQTGPFIMALWALISILFPLTVYLIKEFTFARRIAKKSDEESFILPPRDAAHEQSVFRKAFINGELLYFGISIGVLIIFLLSG